MPIRTCMVTGEKREQSQMRRFTLQEGEVVFDGKKKNPGRGGYIIDTRENREKLPKLKKKIEYFWKKRR